LQKLQTNFHFLTSLSPYALYSFIRVNGSCHLPRQQLFIGIIGPFDQYSLYDETSSTSPGLQLFSNHASVGL
jgi:hypothetical protein